MTVSNNERILRGQKIRKRQVIPSTCRKYHSSNFKMTPLESTQILSKFLWWYQPTQIPNHLTGHPYRISFRMFRSKICLSHKNSDSRKIELQNFFDKSHNLSCNFDLSGHILICHPLSWQNHHVLYKVWVSRESLKSFFTDFKLDLNLLNIIGW